MVAPPDGSTSPDAAVAPADVAELEILPDLCGQSADTIRELADRSGWILRDPPAQGGALAVGQIPQAGSRVGRGAQVWVAWAGGRP